MIDVLYGFWSAGFLKLFLPLSIFGLFSGWAARTIMTASGYEPSGPIPSIPGFVTILNPVAERVVEVNGIVKKPEIVVASVNLPDDMDESIRAEVKKNTVEISKMFSVAALEAARKFKFKPAEKDGEPVEITVKIPFEFKLH